MTEALTVVVTGVGAIIGQGIVRALRHSGRPLRIIGLDRNPQCYGRQLCDVFMAKPLVDEASPDYLNFWRELLATHGVAAVLPGLEIDVAFLDLHRNADALAATRLVLNTAAVIAATRDKWAFGEMLRHEGLPFIPACIDADWETALRELGPAPLLMKPRAGNGSRGIVRLRDRRDYDYWHGADGDGLMLQRIVGSDDDEYTVGLFGFGDGSAVPPIVLRRRLSAAGNTGYAEVDQDPRILAASERMTQLLRPLGPTNYQFRKTADVIYPLEVNPRFSSSTSLRCGFGYNESAMALDWFIDGRRPDAVNIEPGHAWRYAEDYFEHDRRSL